MKKLRVTRDVTPDECIWLTRTVRRGEVFEVYTGHDYGCISPAGVGLAGVDGALVTELPQTALGPVLESV